MIGVLGETIMLTGACEQAAKTATWPALFRLQLALHLGRYA